MQNGTRGNSPAAQTIPSHRLTTFFHSLKKFQRIPPKSHGPHLSALRKCIQSVRFASFTLSIGSSVKQNRRENRETARLEGLTHSKAFRPRLCFSQLIIRWLSQSIKQKTGPISKTFLQGWRVWTADFGGRLVKLGVSWRDVGADGEIVWANASCSPSVPVFSPSPELLSFP